MNSLSERTAESVQENKLFLAIFFIFIVFIGTIGLVTLFSFYYTGQISTLDFLFGLIIILSVISSPIIILSADDVKSSIKTRSRRMIFAVVMIVFTVLLPYSIIVYEGIICKEYISFYIIFGIYSAVLIHAYIDKFIREKEQENNKNLK